MPYAVSGQLGVDLTRLDTGTTTDGQGAAHKLGMVVKGTDDSEWTYVQAGAIITQYSCCTIDENFQAVMATKALVDAGHGIGFNQVAFADNDMGWVCTNASGNINCRLFTSCAADVQLYTTATAGILDDTSASQTLIRGVVAVVAADATAVGFKEIIAQWPSGTATP